MTSTKILQHAFTALTLVISFQARALNLSTEVPFYQNRYPTADTHEKRVDNYGEGDERLYGVRNFRAVLNGAVYRGGANNAYNKYGKRANQNPLPTMGLENLCKEGFGTAVYLYPNNFDSAPHSVSCSSVRETSSTLKYIQQSPYNEESVDVIFSEVLKAIYDPSHGPVYLHCWNGWHASGLISALILRQFCGWSAEKAVAYWDLNTDGNDHEASFGAIRSAIRAFQPSAHYALPSEIQSRICLSQ